jgi:CheY-like chemotaxis protein
VLSHPRPRSTESKFRILYLGTDVKLVAALRKVLTEPGYQFVTCSDRGSAILFLKNEIRYNLLLIDFEWRGDDALELAQLAHSFSHRKRMPIILVAATELSSPLKKSARQAGVSQCVTKPDVDDLSQAIRQLIKR